MNKKYILTIFLILILFLMNIILVVGKYQHKEIAKKEKEALEGIINLNKSLKADYSRIHVFDEYRLPKTILLHKLSKIINDTINIDKLDLKKTKIVFRFSDFSCESCIIQELINLNALAKEIGNDNIIYLGSFTNIRKAISFSKENNLEKSNFYFINYDALGTSLEVEHLPFVFILDESMKINTPFFPRYNIPELSVEYYKIIKQKYFEKQKRLKHN